MLLTLAQNAAGTENSPTVVMPELFGRIDALAHPDNLVNVLQQLSMVWAGVFIAAGLVCLLQGFRIYRVVVIITALLVGVGVGWRLGQTIQAEMIVAGCAGVLLAVVAWPLMKFAVAAFGGLAGAVIGANAWSGLAPQFDFPPDTYWAGAAIGLLMFGLLSFLLFELSVVMFTSFSGSFLAVLGCIALLLQIPKWNPTIAENLQAHPAVVPLLVIVPTVIGLVLQHHFGAFEKKKSDNGGSAKPA